MRCATWARLRARRSSCRRSSRSRHAEAEAPWRQGASACPALRQSQRRRTGRSPTKFQRSDPWVDEAWFTCAAAPSKIPTGPQEPKTLGPCRRSLVRVASVACEKPGSASVDPLQEAIGPITRNDGPSRGSYPTLSVPRKVQTPIPPAVSNLTLPRPPAPEKTPSLSAPFTVKENDHPPGNGQALVQDPILQQIAKTALRHEADRAGRFAQARVVA
jgi:hypothetical protein